METLGRVGAPSDDDDDCDASTTVKRADFFPGLAAEPLTASSKSFFFGFARVAGSGLSVCRFDADARGARRRDAGAGAGAGARTERIRFDSRRERVSK